MCPLPIGATFAKVDQSSARFQTPSKTQRDSDRAGVGGADDSISTDVDGLASVDSLATVDGDLVALDRRQTSVTLIDPDSGDLDLSLRAGEGATNVVTDEFGRVLVADSTGDELLVHTSDPFLLRQRFPVGAAPYAIGYDEGADLVWLTLPAGNEAVAFDLASGIPVEKARISTVRQPNSIAINSARGQLYVASGSGDGIQIVDIREPGGE